MALLLRIPLPRTPVNKPGREVDLGSLSRPGCYPTCAANQANLCTLHRDFVSVVP